MRDMRILEQKLSTLPEFTQRHCYQVAQYTEKLAKSVSKKEMVDFEMKDAYEAGLFHDIGKSRISNEILSKNTKLDDDEWKEILNHPKYGLEMLKMCDENTTIQNCANYHHERFYFPKGYPNGIVGKQIPTIARICCIADSFDAMTANRPYSKAKTIDEAVEELRREAGYQFDPVYVQQFINDVL